MSTIIHHYTNIEALALILRNRTLRFNRLDQVDDPEESNFISNGVNLGIYTFVSCWTEAKEESIPMWKMYTNGKWGVRLSVEKLGLFKTYCDDANFVHNGLRNIGGANLKYLFPTQVRFKQSEYIPPHLNEDYDACQFYRKIEYVDDVKSHANDSVTIEETPNNQTRMNIRYDRVGRFKNRRWAFQEESRFVLNFLPGNPIAAFNTSAFNREQLRFMENIKRNKELGFSHYDMHLSDAAFANLMITMSPLGGDPQRVIVEALCDRYAPGVLVQNSNLMGKLAR